MSVHGANRLGANSLLDIVVFGRACAHHIRDTLKPGTPHKQLETNSGTDTIAELDKLRNANGSLPTAQIRLNMQKVMQNHAAVFRTQESLDEGKSVWKTIKRFFMLKVVCVINTLLCCPHPIIRCKKD